MLSTEVEFIFHILRDIVLETKFACRLGVLKSNCLCIAHKYLVPDITLYLLHTFSLNLFATNNFITLIAIMHQKDSKAKRYKVSQSSNTIRKI